MSNPKLLVIGWDGADWKVASKLLDQGMMPNLRALVERGVMGNISTLYPVLSPMLWTSIATGKRAHKHGIHGFAEPDPLGGGVRPITNLSRSTKAVWNILNQNGFKSNVVGWWPSHPAEPINGVMVSNHFQESRLVKKEKDSDVSDGSPPGFYWPTPPGAVHPPSHVHKLAKFRMHVREVHSPHLLPFVPNAKDIDQEKDQGLNSIAKTIAETTSIHAVATALMQHEPWDFMAVYYDAIDHFSHGFMRYHPPRREWVDPDRFELYKNVIETAYIFHDQMLGTHIQLAGPDTTIMLLSDHGFHPDNLLPRSISNEPAGPADEHRPYGMFVLSGQNIKQDELLFGASLLDVTPTILSIMGLPVGRDMDGRPLVDAFVEPPELGTVESWDLVEGDWGVHPSDLRFEYFESQESLKQLEDLGYIEAPDEEESQTRNNVIKELQYNLARSCMDAPGTVDQAIEILESLWKEYVEESRFGVKLMDCYLKIEDFDAAEKVIRQLIERKKKLSVDLAESITEAKKELEEAEKDSNLDPAKLQRLSRKHLRLKRQATSNPSAFSFLLGSLSLARGDASAALEHFEQASGVQESNLPGLLLKKAECLLMLDRIGEAKEVLHLIFDVDPVNANAHLVLSRCHVKEEDFQLAYEHSIASIGLLYYNPVAHYYAGFSSANCGRLRQATEHLERATEIYPRYATAHGLLSRIHRRLENPQKADHHAEQAKIQKAKSVRPGILADESDVDLRPKVDLTESVDIKPIRLVEPEKNGKASGNEVIIVSGLPRSGTSLMMQLLNACGVKILYDDNRNADSHNPKGYFEYEPVKSLPNDSSWIPNAQGKAVKIVSPLLPFLPVGPEYRIIFMLRPVNQILTSQEKMLRQYEKEGANLTSEQLGSSYFNQVGRLNHQLKRHSKLSLLPIQFDQVLDDPGDTIARIAEFLQSDLKPEMAMQVVDSNLRNH